MRRFLVIFRSHAEGPADVTYVDVEATSPLWAIAWARRYAEPMHGWTLVEAKPWPARVRTLDGAIRRVGNAP